MAMTPLFLTTSSHSLIQSGSADSSKAGRASLADSTASPHGQHCYTLAAHQHPVVIEIVRYRLCRRAAGEAAAAADHAERHRAGAWRAAGRRRLCAAAAAVRRFWAATRSVTVLLTPLGKTIDAV